MKSIDFFGQGSPGQHMQRAPRDRQIDWVLHAIQTATDMHLYYDYQLDPLADHVTIPLSELTEQQVKAIMWDIIINGGVMLKWEE